MLERRTSWLVALALAVAAQFDQPLRADEPRQTAANEQVVAQAEAVQPRLSPRRRTVRARRYAVPRSRQTPQPMPTPADTNASPQANPAETDKSTKIEPRIAPPSSLPSLLLQPPANAPGTPAPFSTKLNLNRATLEQIQRLPGMSPGMAAHVLAGRPYQTVGDLARNGVPFETIEQISPLVTFGP